MKLFALLTAALLALPAQAQTTVAPGGAIYDNATGTFIGFINRLNGREERLSSTIGTGGPLLLPDGTATAPSYSFANEPGMGFYRPSNNTLTFADGGVKQFTYQSSGAFTVRGDTPGLAFAPANDSTVAFDLSMRRDAAGTLALQNGVNSQVFRIYNTFTDASNYERLEFQNSANIWRIRPVQAGTGAARELALVSQGILYFQAGGESTRWQITAAGALGSTGVAFASLGTALASNGSMIYCTDCTIANPCASGGTGAFAKRLNGVNICN